MNREKKESILLRGGKILGKTFILTKQQKADFKDILKEWMEIIDDEGSRDLFGRNLTKLGFKELEVFWLDKGFESMTEMEIGYWENADDFFRSEIEGLKNYLSKDQIKLLEYIIEKEKDEFKQLKDPFERMYSYNYEDLFDNFNIFIFEDRFSEVFSYYKLDAFFESSNKFFDNILQFITKEQLKKLLLEYQRERQYEENVEGELRIGLLMEVEGLINWLKEPEPIKTNSIIVAISDGDEVTVWSEFISKKGIVLNQDLVFLDTYFGEGTKDWVSN